MNPNNRDMVDLHGRDEDIDFLFDRSDPDYRRATELFGNDIHPYILLPIMTALERRGEDATIEDMLSFVNTRTIIHIGVGELLWLNGELFDVAPVAPDAGRCPAPPSIPSQVLHKSNKWAFVSAMVQRHRRHEVQINESVLMGHTGWCHGDIMTGSEDDALHATKQAFLESLMSGGNNYRKHMVPCPHEWLLTGDGPYGDDEHAGRARMTSVLRALTTFVSSRERAEMPDDFSEYLHFNCHHVANPRYVMQLAFGNNLDIITAVYVAHALAVINDSLKATVQNTADRERWMLDNVGGIIRLEQEELGDDFIRETMIARMANA